MRAGWKGCTRGRHGKENFSINHVIVEIPPWM
jgi:hypothetical protein